MFLCSARKGRLVDAKKKRMPIITADGPLALLPCAIVLNRRAAAGSFETAASVVQTIALVSVAANVTLMALNTCDGPRSGPAAGSMARRDIVANHGN